ncbi:MULTISPECIES: type II secretion system protein GspM [unclassified Janthinobacterium]|uniref:type II secretion system protein GspM n=1 Tax=unclassified Janthinobacterium TaxID=2610881 RepID=UPI000C168C0C|nr:MULTISPECIES: type II secretion system protein GspM [unclassified Janthinobacterium]MDO8071793.1 type II secretion system protein GspM [Janthinobacterium sp. SUN176]MED5613251.1 type II secretion system protein GspM [Janthinobacterium sp. P210005]PIF12805.1 MSHA biogenesis protein MshJ [Janthinobacterium sp. 13]
MLPLLKKWAAAFDALSLRERLMVFGAGAAAVLFVFYFMSFNPLLAKRAALEASIAQKQSLLSATDKEVELTMLAHATDPDQEARTRLAALQAETASLAQALREKQHGLVAPERMVTLLEHLLRRHAGLRVVSLKTLPASAVGARQADSANGDAAARAPAPLLHQHGVEVVLQGSYADMVQYMQALQAMPTRVFWGAAHLDAASYPGATLTLTLHTLSMDDTWIAL